jgi:hypothetical protein
MPGMMTDMRRMVASTLLVLTALGLFAVPASATAASVLSNAPVILAFDFSDNSQPASAASGSFKIIADVLALSGGTGGDVRMVAIAPVGSNSNNLVCGYQAVHNGQVECSFSFTTDGVWRVRAEWTDNVKDPASVGSLTVLRVSN